MSRAAADLLVAVRDEVVSMLIETRGTVDRVYLGMDEDDLRQNVVVHVGKLRAFIGERDEEAYVSYVRRWVALRVGAGARLTDLVSAVVEVGEAVIGALQGAFEDTDDLRDVIRRVAHANLIAAQVVVDVLADEHRKRTRQVQSLAAGRGR